MNAAQLQLVRGLQDRMNIIIANYRKDPMYAPPEWTFENIWHALEALTRLEEDGVPQECRDISTFVAAPDSSNLD